MLNASNELLLQQKSWTFHVDNYLTSPSNQQNNSLIDYDVQISHIRP